jgi:hypothetical protein
VREPGVHRRELRGHVLRRRVLHRRSDLLRREHGCIDRPEVLHAGHGNLPGRLPGVRRLNQPIDLLDAIRAIARGDPTILRTLRASPELGRR